jgi:hypothetical protein
MACDSDYVMWGRLLILGLLAAIVACLWGSFYQTSAILGLIFIFVIMCGIMCARLDRIYKHVTATFGEANKVDGVDRYKKLKRLYVAVHVISFVPIFVQFGLFCSQRAWYGQDFHAWLLYVGIGGLLASDILYLYVRSSRGFLQRDTATKVKRAITFAVTFVLYVTTLICVYYLSRINDSIQYHGDDPSASVVVPDNATALCVAKSTSLNGTVSLIWPTTSNDPLCSYIYWEHLRGNILFSISFLLLVLIIRDSSSHFTAFVQVSSLFTYVLYFVGVTSIVDSLDQPWTIRTFEFVVLMCAFGIHGLVVWKRGV